jgi:hypothetical protein
VYRTYLDLQEDDDDDMAPYETLEGFAPITDNGSDDDRDAGH